MVQAPDELLVLHAGGEEVIAQKIGVRALGEERHVVLGNRALHALIQRITREHLFALGAELGRGRGRLQIEEQFGKPVVAHNRKNRDSPYFLCFWAAARSASYSALTAGWPARMDSVTLPTSEMKRFCSAAGSEIASPPCEIHSL